MAAGSRGIAGALLRHSPAWAQSAARGRLAGLHAAAAAGAAATHVVSRHAARAPAREWGLITLYLPGTELPLFARPGTSDLQSFHAIFGRRQHDVEIAAVPRVIFDLGANVGYAAVDFALRYPEAMVVAVEPEPSNARLLRWNTALFDRIHAVEAAVWPRHSALELDDPSHGHWGFQVRESGQPGGTVPAVTVADLMRRAGVDRVDLLKVDIEGAEHELLAQNTDWLDEVGAVFIELHEIRPGATAAGEAVLARAGFQLREQRHENRFYTRPVPARAPRKARPPRRAAIARSPRGRAGRLRSLVGSMRHAVHSAIIR